MKETRIDGQDRPTALEELVHAYHFFCHLSLYSVVTDVLVSPISLKCLYLENPLVHMLSLSNVVISQN